MSRHRKKSQAPRRDGAANTAPLTAGSGPLHTSAAALKTLRQNKHNPLPYLKPDMLSRALEAFEHGHLREAVLLWEKMAERDDMVMNVKPKREKDVSQLDMQVVVEPDSGADGEAHQAVLEKFWRGCRAVNAYDRNERGGFRRLVKQMMTATSFKYAAHHILWTPRADGSLSATFEFVPLWLFENTTGKLRYLKSMSATTGEELDDSEWMVTVGDGLMIACSIGYLAKRSAFNDWLIFSEKFSVPGVLGRTSAKAGTPEAIAMTEATQAFGHDWCAVITGDDGTHAEPIKIVQAQGNPSGMPMPAVIERVDRRIAALYRGADLSSMSSGAAGEGSGASLQEKETDILRRDDAETIAETLAEVSRRVIEWHFGNGVEPLARVELVVPVAEDSAKVVTAATLLADRGAKVSASALMERLNLPMATDEADALGAAEPKRAEKNLIRQDAKSAKEDWQNALSGEAADSLQALRGALAADLQPLGDALAGAYQAGDFAAMTAALKKISRELPELAGDATALGAELAGQMAAAWLGGEEVANAARYNPQDKGARGKFVPWNNSRESRGGVHKDQFGAVPSKANPMDSGQQQDRAWRAMEHVMATQGQAPKAVIREDVGEIQFDHGNPSKETGWGLSHLRGKHPDAWHRIPATLVDGKAYQHPANETKAIIAKGDHLLVIQRKGNQHGWIISGLADPKTIGRLKPLKP